MPNSVDETLRGSDIRTVLVGRHTTLFSPYGPERSQVLSELLESQFEFTAELLNVERASSVPVLLEQYGFWTKSAWVSLDPETFVEWVGKSDSQQVTTYAGYCEMDRLRDERHIVVCSPPLPIPSDADWSNAASDLRETISHELAHALMADMETPISPWLNEATANLVETLATRQSGQTVSSALLDTLRPWRRFMNDGRTASSTTEEAFAIQPALNISWNRLHDRSTRWGPGAQDARFVGLALLAFLLEREGDAPFEQSWRGIAALKKATLLDLEPEFHVWLDATCSLDAAAPSPPQSAQGPPSAVRRPHAGILRDGESSCVSGDRAHAQRQRHRLVVTCADR